MKKIRSVLSVWPSVYLQFSWRYEPVVCGVKEQKESDTAKEKWGFFKSS